MGNLLTKMIWLVPLIILQSAIAIAAPQEGTAQFKFFKERGISRQRLDDGSPTEARVLPKEVKPTSYLSIDDREHGLPRGVYVPSVPTLVKEVKSTPGDENPKVHAKEVKPSSYVVIDDREQEEPREDLGPAFGRPKEVRDSQGTKEAKYEQDEIKFNPGEIVASLKQQDNLVPKEVTVIQDAKDTKPEQEEKRPVPDIANKIIPSVKDVLTVLPRNKDDGAPRDPTKLELALKMRPGKFIQGLNEKYLSQGKDHSTCPMVETQPQDVCSFRAKKAVCWSPGTPDVDCPTNEPHEPFGLCCFDGCQNSCLCKTIIKNVTKTNIVEKCTQATRQVCHPETSTKCVEKCKKVEVLKPTRVMKPVCTDKVVNECQEKTHWEEKCTSTMIMEYAAECPKPEGTPNDCEPECWSPGVDDVDCPTDNSSRPFGLCCFNGCTNKCLKPKPLKECKKIPKVTQECREKKTKECKYVTEVVDKPVIEDICGPECFDVVKEVCKQVPFQQCKPVEEKITIQVPEEVCY